MTVVALVVLVALPVLTVAATAHAQSDPRDAADREVEVARSAADTAADRYFAELGALEALDDDLASLEATLEHTEAEAAALQAVANRRAVSAYKSSGQHGTGADVDTLEAARRAELLDHADAQDRDAVASLVELREELDRRRHELAETRRSRAARVDGLEAARIELDAQVAAAVGDRADLEARLRAQAEAEAATRAATAAAAREGTRPAVVAPPPPADYTPTGGVHPMHDHPFLVCTRARESGGRYGAISASGQYSGAYQFLQSTWNSTGVRAGRADLVGVSPAAASEYDQDDLAWALYQWQGNGPWGGRC